MRLLVQPPAPTKARNKIGEAGGRDRGEAWAKNGIIATLQRHGRDRCARCSRPIEPGLLALAAIMCVACRGPQRTRCGGRSESW
jgi:hypothetical protein